MPPTSPPAAANAVYLALKVLATIAELGMIAGVLYAGWAAQRYWAGIGV